MEKEYEIEVTKELFKQIKPFWKEFKKIRERYDIKLRKLKERMEKKTGIDGIEFFFCDNDIAGIGNVQRTMPLIRDNDLETGEMKERGNA